MPDDAVHFTKMDGTLQGRPYVRQRAVSYLHSRGWYMPLKTRRAAIAATVDNDAWLAPQNGSLVSAVCRAALEYAREIWEPNI
jgi:hypothetical protein